MVSRKMKNLNFGTEKKNNNVFISKSLININYREYTISEIRRDLKDINGSIKIYIKFKKRELF